MATRNGNGTIWKILQIAVVLMLAGVSGLVGYAVTGARAWERLDANCTADEKVHAEIPKLDTRVTRIEGKVENLTEKMNELQTQILTNQNAILQELRRR